MTDGVSESFSRWVVVRRITYILGIIGFRRQVEIPIRRIETQTMGEDLKSRSIGIRGCWFADRARDVERFGQMSCLGLWRRCSTFSQEIRKVCRFELRRDSWQWRDDCGDIVDRYGDTEFCTLVSFRWSRSSVREGCANGSDEHDR